MAGEYFNERKLADNVFALGPNNRRVRYYDYVKTPNDCWLIDNGYLKESHRKPIPKGMTLKQLVEEMEENEDTVECTWCEDLFDKSECRKEVNLGWLCSRCEAAIKSRGEQLTFIENTYWDFLDRDPLDESTAVADSKMVGKYV
jgi:CRISPR/Cas system-associated protein Cas10 (large subunit of type III CRISPR-Cas system)